MITDGAGVDNDDVDTPDDDLLWEAYLEGFTLGKNIEELSELKKQTARENFERWVNRNGILD